MAGLLCIKVDSHVGLGRELFLLHTNRSGEWLAGCAAQDLRSLTHAGFSAGREGNMVRHWGTLKDEVQRIQNVIQISSNFQTCSLLALPVFDTARGIVSQFLVGHWHLAKSTPLTMPLMDVRHIVDDERVHWALFLVITGLSAYPDIRSSLVSIHAPFRYQLSNSERRRFYIQFTKEFYICVPAPWLR